MPDSNEEMDSTGLVIIGSRIKSTNNNIDNNLNLQKQRMKLSNRTELTSHNNQQYKHHPDYRSNNYNQKLISSSNSSNKSSCSKSSSIIHSNPTFKQRKKSCTMFLFTKISLLFIIVNNFSLSSTSNVVYGHETPNNNNNINKKEWSTSTMLQHQQQRPRYHTLYACEGNSLEIVCEEGTHINLIRANFGRFSISVCNEQGNVDWSVNCMAQRSFRVIQERCAGRSRCKIEATVATFNEDACPRVHKYLEVHFNCTKPRFPTSSLIVPGSALLSSSVNNTDNHSHGNVGHHDEQTNSNPNNNNNDHQVSLSPVILFPDPMPPSNGVSSSTSLPPHIDLTSQDIKDQEEAVEKAPLSIVDEPGPIQVKPPKPSNIPLEDDGSSSIDDNDDDDDDSDNDNTNNNNNNNNYDSDSDDPSNDPPYNRVSSTTASSLIHHYGNKPHPNQHPYNPAQNQYNPISSPASPSFPSLTGQQPTAKPPKPDNYEPPNYSDSDSAYTSQPDDVLLVPVPVPVPSIDLVYDYCRPMYAKNLNWNWTMAGNVLRQACPVGAKGIARWSCIIENGEPTWTPSLPDMSNCSSLWIAHLLDRLRSQESIFSLAEELAKGAKGKILYSGDLISAADIIKQLVTRLETKLEESKDDQDRRAHLIKELLSSVLNVASNLLEEIQIESWHELNPHDQRLALRTMVRAVERVAELLADVRSQPNYNFVRTHNNILVSVHVHSLTSMINGMTLPFILTQYDPVLSPMTDSAADVSVHLPYEVLAQHANDQGQVKVVFLIYKRLANLLKVRSQMFDYPMHLQPYAYKHYSVERNDFEYPVYQYQRNSIYKSSSSGSGHHHIPQPPINTIINSDIVGLILATDLQHPSYDRLPTQLNGMVEMTFRHLQTENVTNGRCAYWDMKRMDEDTYGDWSTSGCETVSTNLTHTVCRCNHLTNFAVLMDITNIPMESNDEFALRMITRIGCSISIIALAITLLTLSMYRSLNSIRNSIHKHLCACLLVAEVIFLLGIDETRIKLVCGLIAISLHYFFLAAFLWMFFEGLQLYTMLVQVFESRHNRLTIYCLVAYGAPALLVIVAALVDPLSYGTTQHCWLRTDNHFIWSFLGPALAILLANALFLSLAISVMCRHTPNSMITSTTFAAVHQKQQQQLQQQQQHLKVYPSTLTPSPSYSITEHSKLHSIRIWIRTSFSLLVLLGLTWSFGVLYLARPTIAMAYIFTLLNSLQGLFIFIFCCLLNEKVRSEYRTTLARSLRRCFFFRSLDTSAMAFGTKSSSDSTRSTSLRDSHHLMMNGSAAHNLSQQHLYMQQPAASFLGSRNAAPRTSLLYLNELLGKSEAPTVVNTPTTDQPLIPSQMMTSTNSSHQFQSQTNLDQSVQQQQQQQHFTHSRLSQALSSLSQITMQDDASTSDYGCRRLTQMIEHIYECIDEDPYVAKLLLPAIQRSLDNHQARAHLCDGGQTTRHNGLTPTLLATLNRASQRNFATQMRLQPNSSYLTSGQNSTNNNVSASAVAAAHHTIGPGGLNGLHLPAIVRDNTATSVTANGKPTTTIAVNGSAGQPTIALFDGDQVRCCTLTDHKLCDHQPTDLLMNGNVSIQNSQQQQQQANSIIQALKAQQQQQNSNNLNSTQNNRHHLASEC